MKSVNSRMVNWRVKAKEDCDPPNITTNIVSFRDINGRSTPKTRGSRYDETSTTSKSVSPNGNTVKEIALSTSFEKLSIGDNETANKNDYRPRPIAKAPTEVRSISLQKSVFDIKGRPNIKKEIENEIPSSEPHHPNMNICPGMTMWNMDEEYVPLRRPNVQKDIKTEVPSKQRNVPLRRPNIKLEIKNDPAPATEIHNCNKTTLQRTQTIKNIEDELAATRTSYETLQRSYEAKLRELETFKRDAEQRERNDVGGRAAQILNAANSEAEIKAPICVCERAAQHIRCNICGKLMFGRINETCPAHKKVIFLMDIFSCPGCASPKQCLSYVNDSK